MGQLGNDIYIVGGASTRELLDNVERWQDGRWSQVHNLTLAREGPGVVAHAGT